MESIGFYAIYTEQQPENNLQFVFVKVFSGNKNNSFSVLN